MILALFMLLVAQNSLAMQNESFFGVRILGVLKNKQPESSVLLSRDLKKKLGLNRLLITKSEGDDLLVYLSAREAWLLKRDQICYQKPDYYAEYPENSFRSEEQSKELIPVRISWKNIDLKSPSALVKNINIIICSVNKITRFPDALILEDKFIMYLTNDELENIKNNKFYYFRYLISFDF